LPISTESGALGLFADDKRFFRFASVFLGLVAIGKGLRFPNSWSATQAQIDYSHGFVKRGFFGATLTRFLGLNSYARFAVFSFLALLIVLVLLVAIVNGSGVLERIDSGVAVVVFASSLAMTSLANLVGYFDILQLALTIGVLLIRRPVLRFCAAMVVCAVGILVHESFLLIFLPLILFSFYIDWAEGQSSGKIAEMRAGVLVLLSVALTTVVAMRPSVPTDQLPKLEQEISARINFPLRTDAMEVLGRSAAENLRIMGGFFQMRQHWVGHLSVVLALGPTIAFLLVSVRRLCRVSENVLVVRYGLLAVVCVGVGPLAMHFLGWDIDRFYSLACVALFLAFILLVRALPDVHLFLTPGLRNAMLVVVALNMASGEMLLDVSGPRQFPFFGAAPAYNFLLQKNHGSIVPGR
jgi:hypothetical protein